MQTYIALLRGINVSGQKMIKMAALQAALQSLPFRNTKTYIQSGNVLFQSENSDKQDLAEQIAENIRQNFGYAVAVLVKNQDEWRQVLQNNPFVEELSADRTKLYVAFLSGEPEPKYIAQINPETYAPEAFRIAGNVIYFFCPAGYGQSKLSNNLFESKLKVIATTRNWNTIQELMKMADAIATANSD